VPAEVNSNNTSRLSVQKYVPFHLLFNKGDKRYAEKVNECWKRRSDHPPHGSDG